MNGQELREALRQEMAAIVPPPPLDTAAALGVARRARARRRTGWACAGSAAVVLAVAGRCHNRHHGGWHPGFRCRGCRRRESGTHSGPDRRDRRAVADGTGRPPAGGPDGEGRRPV